MKTYIYFHQLFWFQAKAVFKEAVSTVFAVEATALAPHARYTVSGMHTPFLNGTCSTRIDKVQQGGWRVVFFCCRTCSPGAVLQGATLYMVQLLDVALKLCPDTRRGTAMNGFEFEREFVMLLIEISKARQLKAAPLARIAWPHNKDAATKWRKIRNASPPQELSMRDAFDMVRAMGLTMSELCAIIQGRELSRALEAQAC